MKNEGIRWLRKRATWTHTCPTNMRGDHDLLASHKLMANVMLAGCRVDREYCRAIVLPSLHVDSN